MDTSGLYLLAEVCHLARQQGSAEIMGSSGNRGNGRTNNPGRAAEEAGDGHQQAFLQVLGGEVEEGQPGPSGVQKPPKSFLKYLRKINILPEFHAREVDGYVFFGRNQSCLSKEQFTLLEEQIEEKVSLAVRLLGRWFFTDEVLATSSITGGVSNSGKGQVSLRRLDEKILEDCYILLHTVCGMDAEFFVSKIRSLCQDAKKNVINCRIFVENLS